MLYSDKEELAGTDCVLKGTAKRYYTSTVCKTVTAMLVLCMCMSI